MNALHRLEKGGIRFELTAEGQITYRNTWPGEAPEEWFRPLLDELRAQRAEVLDILQARREWMMVYEEWEAIEDRARDEVYLRRLQGLAVAGGLPCYDGGQADLGAAGWQRVTERLLGKGEGEKGGKGEGEFAPSPLLSPAPAEQTNHSHQKEINAMGIKIEQTTFDAVPTGEYKAVITAIEQVEGKFGPQLQIKSEINDGPYAGNTFLSWVSPKFSPKSRLFDWVEAAMAMAVPKSYTFDSDHLIGREVIATLVVRELDGGGEVNRVDRVRAVAKEQERLPFAG
jgi:hypothetical protein